MRVSFDIPEYTADVTGVGTIRILEAIREVGLRSRFLQASSSEIFGKAQQVPQTEKDTILAAQSLRCRKGFFILGDR